MTNWYGDERCAGRRRSLAAGRKRRAKAGEYVQALKGD